jgi:hypothetical protein
MVTEGRPGSVKRKRRFPDSRVSGSSSALLVRVPLTTALVPSGFRSVPATVPTVLSVVLTRMVTVPSSHAPNSPSLSRRIWM